MLKYTYKLCEEFKKPSQSKQKYQSLNKTMDELVFSNKRLEDRLRDDLVTVRKCRQNYKEGKNNLNSAIDGLKVRIDNKVQLKPN